jgi:hypothetical protein
MAIEQYYMETTTSAGLQGMKVAGSIVLLSL